MTVHRIDPEAEKVIIEDDPRQAKELATREHRRWLGNKRIVCHDYSQKYKIVSIPVEPSVEGCTVGVYTGGGLVEPVNVQEDGDPWTDIENLFSPDDTLIFLGEWQTIETAPKDGTEIDVKFEGGELSTAFWSDKPICMLGPRNGTFPAGWATGHDSGTDYNLPLDPPTHWRLECDQYTVVKRLGVEEKGMIDNLEGYLYGGQEARQGKIWRWRLLVVDK